MSGVIGITLAVISSTATLLNGEVCVCVCVQSILENMMLLMSA